MKTTVKTLIFGLLALTLTLGFTSCGGDGEDPVPVKTDLEKVQDAIKGSTWTLERAVVKTETNTYTYNGDCDFSMFGSNNVLASNTTDVQYVFGTNNKVSWANNCFTQSDDNLSYTITQNGNVFTFTYNHGGQELKFEIQNAIAAVNENEISVKPLVLRGGATEVMLTFSVQ